MRPPWRSRPKRRLDYPRRGRPQPTVPHAATDHARRQLASWRAPAAHPPPPTRRRLPESRPRCTSSSWLPPARSRSHVVLSGRSTTNWGCPICRVLCEKRGFVRGERRPSGHEPYATGDQCDPQPAQRAYLLMQYKPCHQRQQDISQRCGRQHISQVRPRERIHIRSEKGEQKENAHRYPWIQQRENNSLQMMEGNVAGLLHPVGEHGVPSRCKNGYSSQHQILAKGHLGLRFQSFKVSTFQRRQWIHGQKP